MVALLEINRETNYCTFAYDSWSTDGAKLPTLTECGKDELSNVRCACMGSKAYGTDGSSKILSGNNMWVAYTSVSSGGSSTPPSSTSITDDGNGNVTISNNYTTFHDNNGNVNVS